MAIQEAVPEAVSIYGDQDLDERNEFGREMYEEWKRENPDWFERLKGHKSGS